MFVKDCYAMLAAINTISVGSVIYSSGTALIRYLYVRSSMVTIVQDILKSNSFVVKSIVIGECISLFNWGSFYYQQVGYSTFQKSPMVLYQACLDPWHEFIFPLKKVMPLNHFIIFLCNAVNVSCNLFLYRFLANETKNNSAINEVDRKKDRKRNFVPASIGMIVFIFHGFGVMLFMITYTYNSKIFDSATRAFLNAAFADCIHCIISPVILIYGSRDARRKYNEILSNLVAKARPTLSGNEQTEGNEQMSQ